MMKATSASGGELITLGSPRDTSLLCFFIIIINNKLIHCWEYDSVYQLLHLNVP